jgi:hypothetical protein
VVGSPGAMAASAPQELADMHEEGRARKVSLKREQTQEGDEAHVAQWSAWRRLDKAPVCPPRVRNGRQRDTRAGTVHPLKRRAPCR